MVTRESILELVQDIVREFHPEKVILFGSHAYGTPRDDSDADLLVVLPFDGNPLTKTFEVVVRVRPSIPTDIVVRTPEDIQRRLEWHDPFIEDAVLRGEVLYEAVHG